MSLSFSTSIVLYSPENSLASIRRWFLSPAFSRRLISIQYSSSFCGLCSNGIADAVSSAHRWSTSTCPDSSGGSTFTS
jgi:hypothetical protein